MEFQSGSKNMFAKHESIENQSAEEGKSFCFKVLVSVASSFQVSDMDPEK